MLGLAFLVGLMLFSGFDAGCYFGLIWFGCTCVVRCVWFLVLYSSGDLGG